MKIEIDHVTFCSSSLDELRKAFADAGLGTDYGGPHANGVTHMALLGFDDCSYLELIAPMKPETSGSGLMAGWAKLMQSDAGACAWAVRTSKIQDEVERLRAAGIAVTLPEHGGRKKVDGTALRWQTAAAGPGAAGALLPFMIQDETSRDLRVRPSKGARDTGLTSIGMVILGVGDLDAAIRWFRRAYGWAAPEIEEHQELGARLAYFPSTPVMLATPLDDHSWLASRLEHFGDCPLAFLLGTPDVEVASNRFQLVRRDIWFCRKVAWFDDKKLHGARLGVVQSENL
jgi:catechol 2,3-dioxygenase-like lactoylglutathione lyase family enzyme